MIKRNKKAVKRTGRPKSCKAARPARGKASKRPAAKRRASGAAAKAKVKVSRSPESMFEKIGEVTHYFPHVNAAAVTLFKDGLKVGDQIYLKGHTTDFKEKVQSMQLDHVPIQQGKKGQEIWLFVKSRVRIGDTVYRI